MDWHTKIDGKVNIYGQKWAKIAAELSSEFGERIDSEKVRSYYRSKHPNEKKEPQKAVDLLKILDKPHTLAELREKSGKSERVVLAEIEDCRDKGYEIVEIDGSFKLEKHVIPKENIHTVDWNGDKIIRFGVISDTHIGSRWSQLGFLADLYKIFKYEGIKQVYHVGDLTDGFYKNRPGHIYELESDCIGATGQINTVTNFFPDDIPTSYILGNHDATHIMNGGINIGEVISIKRPDMKFLGFDNAVIHLTPNCKIELFHPKDGNSYAQSYQLQRYIDSLSGGDKCNMIFCGHYHKMFYMMYRNIHAFLCGCIEAQTPYMKGKKLSAHIGGLIIEIHVDDEGTITRCKNEFIPCYKPVIPEF